MSNPFYAPSGYPATRQTGPTSAPLRAEFAAIEDAFDKLPALSGNANKLVKVNSSASALTAGGIYEVNGKLGVNNATPSGWLDVKSTVSGDVLLRGSGVAGGSANVLLQGDNGSASAFWFSAGADNKLRIGGTGGTEPAAGILTIDNAGHAIVTLQNAAPALSVNSTMVFARTSDTNLRVSVRGSDGTTRVANLTLA